MRSTLIRGVAIGQNPLDAADLMLERLHGSFLGGLHRAEVIARTEMLDAWRASGTQSRLTVGTDVLDAVMWSAQKSGKTCPACLAMDGTRFPIDTEGPNDHQCGRCSFIPVTKTWEELGFPGLKEPTATYVTGREWFDKQSGRTQERIMGAERLRRLRSGELDWDAMAVTRRSEAWRDSIGVRPLVA
nr:phage minor head protein [Brooklawnia cerclae]